MATNRNVERRVLSKVVRDGGFSVFWATCDQELAETIDRLDREGRIKRIGGSYPFCEYEIGKSR